MPSFFPNSERFILGVPSTVKPILPVPEGTLKIRMRANDVVRVFVRTPVGITSHFVGDAGDHWTLSRPINANRRFAPAKKD